MSVIGHATEINAVQGKVVLPKYLRGASAYEVAVMNGYSGSEEEWIQSFNKVDETLSIKGVAADAKATGEAIENLWKRIMPAAKIVSVSLPAAGWLGGNNLYSQIVSIPDITEKSQVNLTPSVEQLSAFYEKDITFVTENDGGTVTVYVIGQKPTNDYVIKASIAEVFT